MSTRLITVGVFAALSLSLAACSSMDQNHRNTATGAVVGGVIGDKVDDKKK
jgi:hypothetical protein